jgi:hypothetical protein
MSEYYLCYYLNFDSDPNLRRASHHAHQLISLISQFPLTNPSVASQAESQVDIVRLYTQIRSRYKALCSTVGLRPRLVSAGVIPSDPSASGHNDDTDGAVQPPERPMTQSLAF